MWVSLLLATGCGEDPVIVGTSRLADTYDRVGPYVVLTEATDPDGLDEVTLHYETGQAKVVVGMNEVQQGVYEGAIPGQPPFSTVQYFVMAEDGDATVTDPQDALTRSRRFTFRVLGSPCASEIECGPGEFCDDSQTCRQHQGPCVTDLECGKGMSCGADGACRLAARPCVLDEGCLVGEVCDAILAQCMPRPRCGADLGGVGRRA